MRDGNMFGNDASSARLRARREAVLQRTKASSHAPSPKSGSSRKVKVAAAVAAIVGLFGTGIVTGAGTGANAAPIPVGNGFTVTAGDISFILNQIKIAERHVRSIDNEDADAPAGEPESVGRSELLRLARCRPVEHRSAERRN